MHQPPTTGAAPGPPVLPGTATGWELHSRLPHTLPAEEIRAINNPSRAIHEHRTYHWNGWDFDLPPGVFHPGETSRLVHSRLLDGTLPVTGLRYAAMGAGLGVEAVVAGVRGARVVYALDVHPESVRTTARHYERIVGTDGPPLVPLVADVWEGFPDGEQVDVVTFNPPAIELPLTDDPEIVRNLCLGRDIAARFFGQLVARDLLAPGGVVYLILSNTAPLRDIVAMALESGFGAEVVHVEDWPGDNVQTYLFALRRESQTGED
ncbi:class I SAM-dependent methyltransferase [Kibdelosporangium aridum]|uniref:Release factor glutamine methyltransferase n=1 Tax=Kibdelosporangium aridum TaxID=2030 RepID=A0A1Y5Y5X1_KIBAR|nr:methyltransferase [Kibdelosporangium aridum]SMD25966.1 release factor glutamine methyltransferase [Kibdelosporangium aridum]